MDMNSPSAVSGKGLSAVDFALGFDSREMPDSAFRSARLLLLDTLGVCIAATDMEAARLARATAVSLYNTSDKAEQARLLFDGRMVGRPGAAFAAASQIDNLDAHDGYNPTKGHIGVAAVPALMAVAEGFQHLMGRDALAALIVGYEVAGRAGISLHATVSDYHTSGAWNALGVAALGARIRRTSEDVLRNAFGIAEYHGPRSQMMREIANPTMLHDGSGQGALVGLSALSMAEMGFTGAPAITVEADDVSTHWADLGHFWQIEEQYIKPYPVCRWAHAAIDAVREIQLAHEIAQEDIEKIEVRAFRNAVQLFADMPETSSQAQYSLPFAVATMLVHGRIGVEHITGDGLSDPLVSNLVARTKMIEHARHEDRFPEGRWSDVTLQMKDGTVYTSGDVHARGGPERPFSEAEIIDKFMAFSVPTIGETRAAAIRDVTLRLNDPTLQFTELTKHLYEAP